jgi:hypothetical protein
VLSNVLPVVLIREMSAEADKQYLKKHGIPTLFNELTQELFKERPENPVAFMLEVLKRKKAAAEQQQGGAAPAQPAADQPADAEKPAAAAA